MDGGYQCVAQLSLSQTMVFFWLFMVAFSCCTRSYVLNTRKLAWNYPGTYVVHQCIVNIPTCLYMRTKYSVLHINFVWCQGVRAQQQEAEARSLQVRLKTSEDNAELLKALHSPQVTHPIVVSWRTVSKASGNSHAPVLRPQQLEWNSDMPTGIHSVHTCTYVYL